MENRTIGVGFLLFKKYKTFRAPQLFTLEELKDKPSIQKKKGMVSFPLETFEKNDKTYENTIKRMIREEIGVPEKDCLFVKMATDWFQPIPGRNDIFVYYGYGIYLGKFDKLSPADDDILFSGWMTIPQLFKSNIRLETAPILKHFIQNFYKDLLKHLQQI